MKLKELFSDAFDYFMLRKKLLNTLEKMLTGKDYDKGYKMLIFIDLLPVETIYYFLCNCDAEKQMIPLMMLRERDLENLNWIQLRYIRSRAEMCIQYYGENFILPKLCEKVTAILQKVNPDYA